MAFFEDRLSTIPVTGAILPPRNRRRPDELVAWELGGVALQDPSQGLQVQVWEASSDGENIDVYPDGSPDSPLAARIISGETDITEVSLAFNQNMDTHLAFVADGQAKLRWFDSQAGGFVVDDLDPDVTSPVVVLDDKRESQTRAGNNDVLLFYVRAGNLYLRRQRDRFGDEFLLREGAGTRIERLGMSDQLRIQIRMEGGGNFRRLR